MTVVFNDEKHTYTLMGEGVEGKVVPSVTELVAPLGADFDDMDELTELAVENAAEDFELPDQYADYAESVELFLSEHTINPWLIEYPLGCEDFAGTPDLVCDFDGAPTILDYKFVSTIAKTKVGAQLQGYRQLCEQNDLFVDKLVAVQFTRDGYRLYNVDVETTALSFHVCLTLHMLKKKKHPRGCIE